MKRTKGFTLVELLVVVAIIALLVSILLPTLGRAKELVKQAICGSNLKNIGTGTKMYQAENDDMAPWISGCRVTVATGTNADDTGTPASASPTALMFLLVRTKQMSADMFRCPSDDNSAKMDSIRFEGTGGANFYYWDFYDSTSTAECCRRVSYSFQAPISSGGGDPVYSSGYTSGGALAVMADKTPEFDKTGDNGLTAQTDWSGTLSDPARKKGMSQNHDSGDFINVLFADAHVKGGKRADVGISDDNIYSSATGTNTTEQGAGSITGSDHDSLEDSFLVGPVK